jgi:FkbM family methyltransferase
MITIPLEGHGASLYLRPETTDVAVYKEIFIDHQHVVDLSPPPRNIIDGGGNIGLSAVDFALQYPLARVISIEPEAGNFEMLKKNTRLFPNVLPLQAALWNQGTELALLDPGCGAWGFHTSANVLDEAKIQVVPALTISEIIARFKIEVIDILKLDIEGAEREVLADSSDWIHKVRLLIVELHEEISKGCTEVFKSATLDFDCSQIGGGKIVCRRREN